MRVLQLAIYSKGGLGDVREMEETEFHAYYVAMLAHNAEMKRQMKKKSKEEEDD